MTGKIAVRFSEAPRGDPGRLTTSDDSTTPATARDRAAIGVAFNPAANMRWTIPGAGRDTIDAVASGVTSRGPRPVPPVVRTRFPVWTASRTAFTIR